MSTTITEAAAIEERTVAHDAYVTHYITSGAGPALVLLHGSGPGVSGRANWQTTMASPLARSFTLIAPDIVGFGRTEQTPEVGLTHADRVAHLASFLSALDLGPACLIGNSMGGGICLSLAAGRPDLVARMMLMGTAGVSFPLTPEVDQLYGYTPSLDNMRGIIELMAFDTGRVAPELVQLRYEATRADGVQERWEALFPPPRQRHIDACSLPDETLAGITTPTLLVHGAHDRIVPLDATTLHLVRVMPNADAIVLGRCGHWAQVERSASFQQAVAAFFALEDARP